MSRFYLYSTAQELIKQALDYNKQRLADLRAEFDDTRARLQNQQNAINGAEQLSANLADALMKLGDAP